MCLKLLRWETNECESLSGQGRNVKKRSVDLLRILGKICAKPGYAISAVFSKMDTSSIITRGTSISQISI